MRFYLLSTLLSVIYASNTLSEEVDKVSERLMKFYGEKTGQFYNFQVPHLLINIGTKLLQNCLIRANGDYIKEEECMQEIFMDDYFWTK